MRRRRRITYRPSKASGVFGTIWGGIFVLIGLFVIVPAAGAFGLLWTAMAIGITAMNAYQSFGKRYHGPEIHIEEEDGESFLPSDASDRQIPSAALTPKERLEQLENLRSAGLITQAEYQEKRSEILQEL